MTLKKPLIVVNHLEGHALSPKLITDLKYPYLLLLNFWWSFSVFSC